MPSYPGEMTFDTELRKLLIHSSETAIGHSISASFSFGKRTTVPQVNHVVKSISRKFCDIGFTKKIGTLNWCCNTAQLLFTMTFIYVGNLAASFSIYYCCCYCLLHTGSFLNHLAFWEIFRSIEFAGSLWKKQDPVDLENSMYVNPIWLQIST